MKEKLLKTTEWLSPKFRIKVIEQRDGVKMYHPQVYCRVNYKFKRTLILFGDYYYLYTYDWRPFMESNEGIKIQLEKDKDGIGSSDIEYAKKTIDKYITDSAKRQANLDEEEKKKIDKETKSVSYIDVELNK